LFRTHGIPVIKHITSGADAGVGGSDGGILYKSVSHCQNRKSGDRPSTSTPSEPAIPIYIFGLRIICSSRHVHNNRHQETNSMVILGVRFGAVPSLRFFQKLCRSRREAATLALAQKGLLSP
jgi:hypothetical protein